ncbi:MAG: peroxiredoxin [Micrococcales bacterium]
MTILIGDSAPDFTLPNQHGEQITLSSFRGKKAVALVFYPYSFTGICTGELCEIRDNISMFEDDNVEVLAVSCDSKFTQRVFAEQEGYQFSLLSDFWPHGEVSNEYGVFLEENGMATRATFVINTDGVVTAKFVTAPGQARAFADYRTAIAAL